MKRLFLSAIALVGLIGAATATLQHYQAGQRLIDGSQLNLMVDQVNSNTTALTNVVNGVAANYKLARGEIALDGSNPTTASTGLTTIVTCNVALKGTAIVTTTNLTYNPSGTSLNIYGWKPTTTSVTTLTASDGTETVGWICVGT